MSKDIYQCKNCNNQFTPKDKRFAKFCSQSCSAIYNNTGNKKSEETKNKISKSLNTKGLLSRKNKLSPRNNKNIVGDYCYAFCMNCYHCGKLFYARKQFKYCENHRNLYARNNRALYEFSFNIYNYPDLFDLTVIKKYGWYNNKTNKNGITRDHKISINESIKNKYDPYYIKHPLNCELMLWGDNYKKYTNSSLTYKELVKIVDEFDKLNQ